MFESETSRTKAVITFLIVGVGIKRSAIDEMGNDLKRFHGTDYTHFQVRNLSNQLRKCPMNPESPFVLYP